MKIINMLPVLAFGDAVGNDTVAIHKSLKKAGYDSCIVASVIDQRITEKPLKSAEDLSFITGEDLILYHLSTGHELNRRFLRLPGHKIVRYHNITPPEFFGGYNKDAMINCMEGYIHAAEIASVAEFCFADSAYNKSELLRMGYTAPCEVSPILIPFSDYEKEPDAEVLRDMADGKTNLLFTGRIAPNKRQEDVIAAFYDYHKYYNPDSRLILVGNYAGMEKYYDSLMRYIDGLGIREHVIFPGHISFAKILAYYRSAHLFLCMSDHEGFCVPIVEAMYFGIPIVAKNTTAVGETLGGGGILLKDQDPAIAAAAIHRLLTDSKLKERCKERQQARLRDFDHDRIERQILEKIATFTGGSRTAKP